MAETKKECEEKGGIGKFAEDICFYCTDLKDCKVASEGYKAYLKEQDKKKELKKQLGLKRLGGRKPNKGDLVCMYCLRNAKNCTCRNKPEGRFELKVGRKRKL